MGKLIVFEGTDGSGKSTQFRLLTERLKRENVNFYRLQFPQYQEPSSALIRMYLGGEFGENPDDVNAYAASTFYAVDRYASYVKTWGDYYRRGGLVLSDRYVTSNAVHQAVKVPPEERRAFLNWLYDLEYQKMGLPRPDLVICLDMPTHLAARLMRGRAVSYTHLGALFSMASVILLPASFQPTAATTNTRTTTTIRSIRLILPNSFPFSSKTFNVFSSHERSIVIWI